jgi:HD-like signal output (HDOD) protein
MGAQCVVWAWYDSGREEGQGEDMTTQATTGVRPRIGEQLVRAGLITREQLEQALAEQKRTGAKIVATLVTLGHIEQRTFLNFLAKQPGIASIDLSGYCIPSELLAIIPAAFARKHEIVPMDRMGKELTVGMACPLDVCVIEELSGMTGLRVRALLVSTDAIRLVLDRYYPELPVEESAKTVAAAAEPAPAVSTLAEARPAEAGTAEARPAEAVIAQVTLGMTFDCVMTLVRAVSTLPALPDTVRRVQEAVENPVLGARDVAEILKGDPALAAKIISLANAPVHGLRHRVDSIEGATALLGLREVYSVTLAAAVVDSFGQSAHFDYNGFWRRSITCGTIAKVLARSCGMKETGGVFAAGLLHDLGRVVFAEIAPVQYGALDLAIADDAIIQLEHNVFGIAHPEVGYIVARDWAFPAPLSEAIRFHHAPERAAEAADTVRLVALAAILTDHLELPDVVTWEVCHEHGAAVLSALGINDEQVIGILDIARALRNASVG